ncbi:DUF3298 and DUF4163 domain-containing protein [Metabacillus sp. RGM 3146]|uniref:DUF3298 and DUF4163 domain-containing protein n=1 Tax=Metabacillus sp. RGM 3146 TaxID=3401092 RepID=UPI003B994DF2
MKKTMAVLLAAGVVFGAAPHQTVLASSTWGSGELKKGQIGKVTALADAAIYTKSGSSWSQVYKMKKGQVSRVYTNRDGFYGLGGGKFVKSSSAVKYETPSKSRYEALNGVKVVKHQFKDAPITYAQVTGAANPEAEKKINAFLYKEAEKDYAFYLKFKQTEEQDKKQWEKDGKPYEWRPYEYEGTFEIHFNQNHLLSVVNYSYQYMGGAHGMTAANALNFNTLNGSQFQLSDVIHNKFKTVQQYVVTDLKNQHDKKQNGIELSALKTVRITNNSTWTFDRKGIKIIFGEYEVAPYAAGMPVSIVPMSVYQ